MPVYLFTDFSAADLYVGQVKAAIHRESPHALVIDLLHDAPAFNVKAAAHLLAALVAALPRGGVILAVVDPGVGGARAPVAVAADDRWLVGPDNGLLSVVAARAAASSAHSIAWRPSRLSHSFHGRDLFAPVAAMIDRGHAHAAGLGAPRGLDVELDSGDLAEIVYIDHYGNAMTGLRADAVEPTRSLIVGAHRLGYARAFAEVPTGAGFWYENSLGLIEIAANRSSASAMLGLTVGDPVILEKL